MTGLGRKTLPGHSPAWHRLARWSPPGAPDRLEPDRDTPPAATRQVRRLMAGTPGWGCARPGLRVLPSRLRVIASGPGLGDAEHVAGQVDGDRAGCGPQRVQGFAVAGRVAAAPARPPAEVALQLGDERGLRLLERHRDPGAGRAPAAGCLVLGPAGDVAALALPRQRQAGGLPGTRPRGCAAAVRGHRVLQVLWSLRRT